MPRTCSIARTLEIVGERWAILVLREAMLGNGRFEGILEATGAPRAILTQRLKALVEQGIIERYSYQLPGQRARWEYKPTAAGRDLQPVLTALMDWGDRHLAGTAGPPAITRHRACGATVHAELRCEHDHRVGYRELAVTSTV
jgi:DNA-binding HxlR family transcriptional regulator